MAGHGLSSCHVADCMKCILVHQRSHACAALQTVLSSGNIISCQLALFQSRMLQEHELNGHCNPKSSSSSPGGMMPSFSAAMCIRRLSIGDISFAGAPHHHDKSGEIHIAQLFSENFTCANFKFLWGLICYEPVGCARACLGGECMRLVVISRP